AGTLLDLFAAPRANLWWFLEISEKSPLRGPLVNQLYFLALIRAVVSHGSYAEVWLSLADGRLARAVRDGASLPAPVRLIQPAAARRLRSFSARAWLEDSVLLRYLVRLSRAFALHLLSWAILHLTGTGKWRPGAQASIVFFSFYPVWWNSPYGAHARERFFELLPAELSRRGPVHYAVWLTLSPFELWRRRRDINEVWQRLNVVPLQRTIGPRDSLSLLSPTHLARLLRLRFFLARRLRATFEGFDIAPLVVKEVYRSMTSSEFFLDLLLMRGMGALTARLPTRALVYRVEFQPFEKAVLYGVRGRSRAVAFQHSTFGRNYLSHFFPPGEIAHYRSNGSDPSHMPLPDTLLTTGTYARDVMARNGFASESLDVCGPVRYARLLRYLREREDRAAIREKLGLPASKKVFLVMTSVVSGESRGLLAALALALEGLDERPCIVFKGHPALPMDREFQRLVVPRLAGGDYRVLPVDAPLYDYMSVSDAVILAGSTVCLEAIVLGVVPIVFESKSVLDAKSMTEIKAAALMVSNQGELGEAMRGVARGDERLNELRRCWPQALEAMFYRLDGDPNERFAAILERRGILAPGA
ncbi:MAG: hypothetical protein HY330_07415, partial [Chloroflexi bacterium]|nr:hypothetical protein [Chloroflexota bacterium]